MGIEEFIDLDIDEFQRRSMQRLLLLVDRHRPSIERELGQPINVEERSGRIEISVAGAPIYVASTTASGRLLLTDISGRYSNRL